MLMTARKPVTVGEFLDAECIEPMRLTQGALADAMGVRRKHVNEPCNDREQSPRRPRSFSPDCSATVRSSG